MLEIFGTESCVKCNFAKSIAVESGIHYVYKNVTYKQYLNELTNRLNDCTIEHVPYIFMNGNLIGNLSDFTEFMKKENGKG